MNPDSRSDTPRVRLREIVKSFGGVRALRGVDLDLAPSEIHAICGENGAGKSTLMGVLGGAVRPDSGRVEIGGVETRWRGPADALRQGIAVIHQEIRLVPTLTVAENLALGDEPARAGWLWRGAMIERARTRLSALGFDLEATARVADLRIGQRQLVEIARALGRRARVVVLDEPTAALGRAEAERLFAILDELRRSGLAIALISHQLDDVFRMSDRVTVLRDGARVGTWPIGEQTRDGLVRAMIGDAEVESETRRRGNSSPTGRSALNLEVVSGRTVRGVTLSVGRGEVVGVTGLAGAGHEELGELIVGVTRPRAGRMTLAGVEYAPRHPADAMGRGVGVLAADRASEGLIPTCDVEANVSVSALPAMSRWGWHRPSRRRALAERSMRERDIVCRNVRQNVRELSGGNQQKVLISRLEAWSPSVLVLNEPTRGVDVRNREAIHAWVSGRASAGAGVLVIGSDTHEMLGLTDRIAVMRRGVIVAERSASEWDETSLVAAVMGDAD